MVFTGPGSAVCWMYLGDYIVIQRHTGPFTFECCSVSTDTMFTAEVDPDKRHLFPDTTFPERHPSACRFSARTGTWSAARSTGTARRSAKSSGVR